MDLSANNLNNPSSSSIDIPLPSSPKPQSFLSFPSSIQFPSSDGFFTGSDFGADNEHSLGLTKLNPAFEAKPLQPFNPSSPPRKKVRGGNKRKYIEGKLILDLNEDNWGRFFIIKKKEGSFATDCSFALASTLKSLLGKTKSNRKLGDGSLCIEAASHEQARNIESINKINDCEVIVGPHKKLNSSQGVITCRDFLNSSLEAIKDGLAHEGVIDVRRIKRRQGESLVDTASLVLTFDRPKPPTEVEAAFYKLKVRPYIPSPMRCFKCQRFGHTSQRCKAQEQICVCGKLPHEGDCTPPITCVNCGNEHTAKSANCPVLQMEKEIQKVKTLQQLPYHEAKALVKSKSFVKPDISFAEKVAKVPSKNQHRQLSCPPNTSTEQAKSGTSCASKEELPKMRASPSPHLTAPFGALPKASDTSPSNLRVPSGAQVAERLPQYPPAESGGVSEVGRVPPQKTAPPAPEWRVVSPRRRAQERSDQKREAPRKTQRGAKTRTATGDSRITKTYYVRRSPRPKWELLGTDLEASESEGGGCSERPPTQKRRGRQKQAPRKLFTD